MKILVVAERLPSRLGGGAARQFNLLRELSLRHEISVAACVFPDDLSQLSQIKPYVNNLGLADLEMPLPEQRSRFEWQLDAWKHALLEPFPKRGRLFYTANFRQIIRQIITEQNPDILFVHQAYLMPLLPETSVPIVLDMMDILSEHERQIMDSTIKITHRIQGWLEWKKMQAVERSAVRRAAFCTVVSKDDQQKLLELIPHKVAGAADPTAVVPNGVDTDYFQPSGSDDVEKGVSILFTGSMNYDPNSDAARWFYSQIFPFIRARCPNCNFLVVGWNPPTDVLALNSDTQVSVTGYVEDIRPYFEKSTLVVAPIRFGSGTRLKILEAWAMGKAVVATRLGAQGIKAFHEENILIADGPEEFASAVLDLLGNAEKRRNIGQAARQMALTEYTWPQIAQKLEGVFEQVIAAEGA